MATSSLFARIALVIGVAPLLAACGETGSSTNTTSAGGSAGSGGSGGTAGSGGSGGSAGSGVSGSSGSAGAAACERALPTQTGAMYCHNHDDCSNTLSTCSAETLPPVCAGSPQPPNCTSDEACNEGVAGSAGVPVTVCQQFDSYKYCAPPCTDDSTCGLTLRCEVATGHCLARACDAATPCPEGTYCGAGAKCLLKQCDPSAVGTCTTGYTCDGATFACVAKPCSTVADCPADNFVCEQGACARKPCACDTECGASGYCVRGLCDESPGHCLGQIACGRPLVIEGTATIAPLTSVDGWG